MDDFPVLAPPARKEKEYARKRRKAMRVPGGQPLSEAKREPLIYGISLISVSTAGMKISLIIPELSQLHTSI